jgi:hypothetical protein
MCVSVLCMYVCMYEHSHLFTKIDVAGRHDLVETLWVGVASFDVSYYVCVCYHPPSSSLSC